MREVYSTRGIQYERDSEKGGDEREREYGISYVAISRATDLRNACNGVGCSVGRLTFKLSSKKKLKIRLL